MRMEKKLDGNYTRMLPAVWNKSWRQHPTKQQLYGHQLSISKTIQVRLTRHAGHCERSKDELISDILQWTPSHRLAKGGRPARTYIQQFCANTGYRLEDILAREGQRGMLAAWHNDDTSWIILHTNFSWWSFTSGLQHFSHFQDFEDLSKCNNYNWYHRHPNVPPPFHFSSKVSVLVIFPFLLFSLSGPLGRQVPFL